MSGGYVSLCVYVMKEVFLMAEDFVGVSGSLNESFVGADNDKRFLLNRWRCAWLRKNRSLYPD